MYIMGSRSFSGCPDPNTQAHTSTIQSRGSPLLTGKNKILRNSTLDLSWHMWFQLQKGLFKVPGSSAIASHALRLFSGLSFHLFVIF